MRGVRGERRVLRRSEWWQSGASLNIVRAVVSVVMQRRISALCSGADSQHPVSNPNMRAISLFAMLLGVFHFIKQLIPCDIILAVRSAFLIFVKRE